MGENSSYPYLKTILYFKDLKDSIIKLVNMINTLSQMVIYKVDRQGK